MSPPPPDPRRQVAWGFFLVCLLITFLIGAAWSLAMPLFSAPDEPAQIGHAVAVDRGQPIGGTLHSAASPVTQVRIPAVFVGEKGDVTCLIWQVARPASCANPMSPSRRIVTYDTYIGRYPPLYYVFVGLPSIVVESATGIYLMRLVSALLVAILISLGLFAIARWSRNRLLLIGVVLAATPMQWYLAGMVNPNGMEIAAAICLWSAGFVLVREHSADPPTGLVAIVVAAVAVLLLSRPLSPVWVVLITGLLAVAGGKSAALALFGNRRMHRSLFVLVPCAVFAVWWVIAAHALDLLPFPTPPPTASSTLILGSLVTDTGAWLRQMIAVFSWNDVFAPKLTYILWSALVGGVTVLAVTTARLREALTVIALVTLVLVLPVAISFDQIHRLGVVWQGRYTLPLAAGLPLLAIGLIRHTVPGPIWTKRIGIGICCLAALAEAGAFMEALRRFTVGIHGPVDYLHGPWQPPLGALLVTVIGVAATVGLTVLVSRVILLPPGDREDLRAVVGGQNEVALEV